MRLPPVRDRLSFFVRSGFTWRPAMIVRQRLGFPLAVFEVCNVPSLRRAVRRDVEERR